MTRSRQALDTDQFELFLALRVVRADVTYKIDYGDGVFLACDEFFFFGGEGSTIHFPHALFFFFLIAEISSRAPVPFFFWPEPVHSGSAR